MSPATRLQPKPINLRNGKYTHWSPEPTSDSDSGPGADSDSGPGGDHHLGNKTGFPPRTWPYPHAMPSAAARKTQGARAHPPIPLDRPGGTPSVHSGRFPPLTGGCFLQYKIYFLFFLRRQIFFFLQRFFSMGDLLLLFFQWEIYCYFFNGRFIVINFLDDSTHNPALHKSQGRKKKCVEVGCVVWFGVDEGVYNPKNIFAEKKKISHLKKKKIPAEKKKSVKISSPTSTNIELQPRLPRGRHRHQPLLIGRLLHE